MDFSDSDFKYDIEDTTGIALAQGFALVLAALATLVCAAHYVGVGAEFGDELKIPYSTAAGPALVVFALACAAILPTRYRHVWSEPRARGRIVIGLTQTVITAIAAALGGYLLAGAQVELSAPGQSVVTWLCYGLVIGGAVQATICVAAFVLLLLGREMPELGD